MTLNQIHRKLKQRALYNKHLPHDVCEAIAKNIKYTVIKKDGTEQTKTLLDIVDDAMTIAGVPSKQKDYVSEIQKSTSDTIGLAAQESTAPEEVANG